MARMQGVTVTTCDWHGCSARNTTDDHYAAIPQEWGFASVTSSDGECADVYLCSEHWHVVSANLTSTVWE